MSDADRIFYVTFLPYLSSLSLLLLLLLPLSLFVGAIPHTHNYLNSLRIDVGVRECFAPVVFVAFSSLKSDSSYQFDSSVSGEYSLFLSLSPCISVTSCMLAYQTFPLRKVFNFHENILYILSYRMSTHTYNNNNKYAIQIERKIPFLPITVSKRLYVVYSPIHIKKNYDLCNIFPLLDTFCCPCHLYAALFIYIAVVVVVIVTMNKFPIAEDTKPNAKH